MMRKVAAGRVALWMSMTMATLACDATVGGGPDEPIDRGATGSGGSQRPVGRGGAGGTAPAGPAGAAGGPAGTGGTSTRDGGSAQGGTGPAAGEAGAGGDLPPLPASRNTLDPITTPVVISELMYHPADETSLEEIHEFVEIHNRTAAPVMLGGWKLTSKKVAFTFPASATIQPKQYLVIAKNRTALAAVTAYGLNAPTLLGDYTGQLDNGGDLVTLTDAKDALVDQVVYRDNFPFPIAADAFGIGEAWLPTALKPMTKHRFMGHSLERISVDLPSDEIANWDASKLDGATPGKANGVAGTPSPIAESLFPAPETPGATGLVSKADAVIVTAKMSAWGKVSTVSLDWWVDIVTRTDEPITMAPMMARPDGTYQAKIPAQADGSVVRYRLRAERGRGMVETITPRATDPYQWHAYFVTPAAPSKAKVYHLFVEPVNWTKLWDNIQGGPNNMCTTNNNWQAVVPATFVAQGKVYDVRVRYQGSRFQRTNGLVINSWTAPGPQRPINPLKVLSFKVRFPKYRSFNGQRGIYLNKMSQGCPGVEAFVGTKLHAAAGNYGFGVGFARLYVNGQFYQYVAEFEEPRAEFFERRNEEVGDLFKVHGAFGDEGLYGRGDGAPLKASCGFTAEQRYAKTYGRKTHDWKQTQEVKQLLDGMTAAKAQGTAALRTFIMSNFDVPSMMAYVVVRNWSGAWDDVLHNHYIYRKPSGKWTYISWDFDCEFGECRQPFPGHTYTPTVSLYIGQEGNAENRAGPHFSKSAIITAMKPEYDARMKELSKTVLATANVHKIADEYLATFSVDDFRASPSRAAAGAMNIPPGGYGCDPVASANRVKKWATERNPVVTQRLGP